MSTHLKGYCLLLPGLVVSYFGEFVPVQLDIFLEPVNPGVSKDGCVIYQVAPDAKGFTLTLDDVELAEDESAVFDLGNIGLRSYEPASPGATATATAGP